MSRHTCLAQERLSLTLSLPNVVKGKFRPDFQISFSNILKNKKYHVKVQAGSFHLNGRIVGFRPQTQTLQSPFKTPSSTLAVKGYTVAFEHPASIFGDPGTVSPAGRNGAPKWFIPLLKTDFRCVFSPGATDYPWVSEDACILTRRTNIFHPGFVAVLTFTLFQFTRLKSGRQRWRKKYLVSALVLRWGSLVFSCINVFAWVACVNRL